MHSKTYCLLLVLMLGICIISKAQESEVIQVSGVVLQQDSLQALPYTSILIWNSDKGTISDNTGYFSLFVNAGDTLQFSSVGYKTTEFILPYSLRTQHYSLIQLMKKDTIFLEQITVTAWPDLKDLMQTFLDADTDDVQSRKAQRMQKELAVLLREEMELDKAYYNQMRYSKLYQTTGVVPPNNFLNPFTWAKFIKDWRDGVFKSNKEYFGPDR